MRNLIFIPFILLFYGCPTSSRMSFLTVPDIAARDTVDIKTYETNYGKYDGVYLSIENTIEHAGSKLGLIGEYWEYFYVMHKKYIVLNPDDESLTTFTLNIGDNKHIGNLFLQATYPDGKKQRWLMKDLMQVKDPDGYVRNKFIYPRVVKGTIIEEGFELNYDARWSRPPLQYEIPLQYSIPCENLQFSFAYPEWWTIGVKRSHNGMPPPYSTMTDSVHNKILIQAVGKNIPALTKEPYAPYFKEVAQYLEFMIKHLAVASFHYDCPADWNEFTKKYKPYILDRDGGFLSSKVAKTTDGLIKDITDPYKKLDTIITYLQKEITPVDDWVDRDFADVLYQKKGSVYAITGLAHSMLKKAGLSPQYVLIHSAREGAFDSLYISFDQFSVPAVELSIDNKMYIVFPYEKTIPVYQVPRYYQDQPMLVIGDKKSYEITPLSLGSYIENKELEEYDISISDDGMTKVREIRTFYGTMASFMRDLLEEVKPEDQEKLFKKEFIYDEESTKFISHSIDNEKEYKLPLKLTIEYSIENLATIAPEEVLFRTAGLLSPATIKDFRVEDKDRCNPIDISFDEEIIRDVTVHYPAAWKLKSNIKSDTLENRFGSLKSVVDFKEGLIRIQQHRHLNKCKAQKEQINELVQLAGRKAGIVLPTIIFTKK